MEADVSEGGLPAMGAADAEYDCPGYHALNMLGFIILNNLFPESSVPLIEPMRGVGITVAPDGKPAGLPIPITSAFAFRTMATPTDFKDCGKNVSGFTVICGKSWLGQGQGSPVTMDVLLIDWNAPPAGTGILPFLNIDRDGQPGNNVKATAQFPYDTPIGGDGVTQIVAGPAGAHVLQLADEVTGKLVPITAFEMSADDAAAWVIFNPKPGALYLPGVYDYTGTDFAAPHVGFDVASPASVSADPAKPDLASLFFVPPVIHGP